MFHEKNNIRECFQELIDTCEYENKTWDQVKRQFIELWNCSDILPVVECEKLDIPQGSTYSQALRHLRNYMLQRDYYRREIMKYGTEIYKGTKIIWDEDHDERIYIFIDDLKAKYPDVFLYSCYEHKARLELVFKNYIPLEYQQGKQIEVIDRSCRDEHYGEDRDDWYIEESKIH